MNADSSIFASYQPRNRFAMAMIIILSATNLKMPGIPAKFSH
jgi:hypothetical protein